MRRVSGRQLAIAAAFSVIATFIAVGLSVAIEFFRKDWSSPVAVVAVVALASISGVLPLFKKDDNDRNDRRPPPRPDGRPTYPPRLPQGRDTRRRGPLPLVVAALFVLVFCGGGAAAATYGVQWAGGFITGHEDGTDVLVSRTQERSGDLTLAVTRVALTRHFTRVEMTASNSGSQSLGLPVYRNCQLNPAGGATIEADAFRSDWPESVPPGGLVTGTVVFKRLPDGVTSASLSFATIFGLGAGAITVSDISLRST